MTVLPQDHAPPKRPRKSGGQDSNTPAKEGGTDGITGSEAGKLWGQDCRNSHVPLTTGFHGDLMLSYNAKDREGDSHRGEPVKVPVNVIEVGQ